MKGFGWGGEVNNKKSSVVYIPDLANKNSALIIIQGKEERLFERDILKYLRHKLPENGWPTLGVNIPNVKYNSRFLMMA